MIALTNLAFFEESYKIYLLFRYVLYPLIPKFYENACYQEPYPCFDLILVCLDVCLTCLDKMHVLCYISILTLMSYDNAWIKCMFRAISLY